MTYNRYGHLMPNAEDAAAGQLRAFLQRETGTETGTEEAGNGSTEPLNANNT
jgi:hypothetical protein